MEIVLLIFAPIFIFTALIIFCVFLAFVGEFLWRDEDD